MRTHSLASEASTNRLTTYIYNRIQVQREDTLLPIPRSLAAAAASTTDDPEVTDCDTGALCTQQHTHKTMSAATHTHAQEGRQWSEAALNKITMQGGMWHAVRTLGGTSGTPCAIITQ